MAEDIEVKIEKLNASIQDMTEQKNKHLSKIAALEEKIERQQLKLKDLKSGTLINACEQQDLSIKDIQVISKGIADGSMLEYLGIRKSTAKEKEGEKIEDEK